MPAVVLFDGVCNFCNSTVDFIIERDPQGHFRFAALQTDAARAFLSRCSLPADLLDNIVLIEEGVCYARSTAVLRIVRRLRKPWPLVFYGLIVIPRPIRDLAYDWFARNRYRWFGKRAQCSVPSLEIRRRFLE